MKQEKNRQNNPTKMKKNGLRNKTTRPSKWYEKAWKDQKN